MRDAHLSRLSGQSPSCLVGPTKRNWVNGGGDILLSVTVVIHPVTQFGRKHGRPVLGVRIRPQRPKGNREGAVGGVERVSRPGEEIRPGTGLREKEPPRSMAAARPVMTG
jgi:hypothetical protein